MSDVACKIHVELHPGVVHKLTFTVVHVELPFILGMHWLRGKSRRWMYKEWASRGMRMQVGREANHKLTRHGQASSGAKEYQLAAKW